MSFRALSIRRIVPATLVFSLAACVSSTPLPTPQVIAVYATPAAQPWLADVYACAPPAVVIRLSDPASAEIVLRLGEPSALTTPAYQIGSEEILVVTGPESPIRSLTLDEARSLFAGQGDPVVQVWVYTSGEDIQQIFDAVVMRGTPVASAARLAAGPAEMAEAVRADVNAIGLLPGRSVAGGGVREVLVAAEVPVLVVTRSGPEAALRELIACLQR